MLRCHVCGMEIKVLLNGERRYLCSCGEREHYERLLARRIEQKRREVEVVDLLESVGNPIHWPCGRSDCALCNA